MQKPQIVMDILNLRSKNNHPITELYKYLYNPEWYIIAYKNLCEKTNSNALIDELVLKRINDIITLIKKQQYTWTIPNDINAYRFNKFKSLNASEWKDKLLQEVLRILLNTIYDSKFSNTSHAYRLNKGCHTALARVHNKGIVCDFFIFGRIENITNIDKDIIQLIEETITDQKFLVLLRKMLKCHNLKDEFVYDKTYSKTPIGGILSPLFLNIYLNEFDQWVESNLVSKWNREKVRPLSKEYVRIQSRARNRARKYRKTHDESILKEIRQLKSELQKLPSKAAIEDTTFRRLSYTRYADQWIITFTGTFQEAQEIFKSINDYLKTINLKLDSSSRIVNSSNEKNPVEFLGYNIITQWNDSHMVNGVRRLCGNIALLIPYKTYLSIISLYTSNKKPCQINTRIHKQISDIVKIYQNEFLNIVQYYKFARNNGILFKIKWIMQNSMLRTIAAKTKTSVAKLVKKYSVKKIVKDSKLSVIAVKDSSSNQQIFFGGIHLNRQKLYPNNTVKDEIIRF